jgi:ribosomal protein L37AE/L43A
MRRLLALLRSLLKVAPGSLLQRYHPAVQEGMKMTDQRQRPRRPCPECRQSARMISHMGEPNVWLCGKSSCKVGEFNATAVLTRKA